MKNTLLNYLLTCFCFGLFLTACKSNRTAYTYCPQTVLLLKARPDSLAQQAPHAALSANRISKTVAFSAKKVKPFAALILPKPNTNSTVTLKTIIPKKHLKPEANFKTRITEDEPIKGKSKVISGIFLAVGMALLLVAGVLFLIGTSGAGLLAWIGGGSFLIGAILAIVSLLSY